MPNGIATSPELSQAFVDERFADIQQQFEPTKLAEPLISRELKQRRTLTEVDHLYDAMDEQGNVPLAVELDIKTNIRTAVSEIAMPYAVSKTVHEVEYRHEHGRRRRVIMWLGKTATENAENGRLFHSHPAALERTDIEVDEARDAEETLRAGFAKIFISPKMSRFDASLKVAKSEHLADDDSLRVSRAVTNKHGEVITRELESLLVADIPLEAWYAWLKSPANLLDKAYHFSDERSALPIMKLFRELEVPEDRVPEGPVSVLVDVLSHITDPQLRHKLNERIKKYRKDQALYKEQAEDTANRWFDFDFELARSRKFERLTPPIQEFMKSLEGQWDDEAQQVLDNHRKASGGWRTSRDLEEVLEYAKQNILNSEAGIATGNEKLLRQVSPATAQVIVEKITVLRDLRANGAPPEILMAMGGDLNRFIANQNFKVGGGCPGDNDGNFKKNKFGKNIGINSSNGKFEIPDSFEVLKCVTCPLCNKEGVDATIEHYNDKKVITCLSCKGSKTYEAD